jgi:hypothetical protein
MFSVLIYIYEGSIALAICTVIKIVNNCNLFVMHVCFKLPLYMSYEGSFISSLQRHPVGTW